MDQFLKTPNYLSKIKWHLKETAGNDICLYLNYKPIEFNQWISSLICVTEACSACTVVWGHHHFKMIAVQSVVCCQSYNQRDRTHSQRLQKYDAVPSEPRCQHPAVWDLTKRQRTLRLNPKKNCDSQRLETTVQCTEDLLTLLLVPKTSPQCFAYVHNPKSCLTDTICSWRPDTWPWILPFLPAPLFESRENHLRF